MFFILIVIFFYINLSIKIVLMHYNVLQAVYWFLLCFLYIYIYVGYTICLIKILKFYNKIFIIEKRNKIKLC